MPSTLSAPRQSAIASENCGYFIKTADAPGVDAGCSHPPADAVLPNARPSSLPAPFPGSVCFWGARDEAVLSPAAAFPGRCGASTGATALAGSPNRGLWLFPHQGQGQIPSPGAPIGCLCLCLLMTLKAVSCGKHL